MGRARRACFAPALGLGEDWLRATWDGTPADPAFTPRQALLVRMCDELHDDATLVDATFAALREAYADDQLVELVCLAGFYHLVRSSAGRSRSRPSRGRLLQHLDDQALGPAAVELAVDDGLPRAEVPGAPR